MHAKECLAADSGPRGGHGPSERRWRGAPSWSEPGELAYLPTLSGESPSPAAVDWLDFNACVRAVAAELHGVGLSVEEHYAELPCVYLQEDELRRVATALLIQARASVARAGRPDGCIRIETRSQGAHLVLTVSHNGVCACSAPAGSGRDTGNVNWVLFPLDAMEASLPTPVI